MFLLSNNHLWSSSFKKYHHFSVFSVFIFSLFLTYRAIFQLLGSEEKSHINNLFLYWPQLTSLTVWILTCPGYVNLLRDGLLSHVQANSPEFNYFWSKRYPTGWLFVPICINPREEVFCFSRLISSPFCQAYPIL